MKSNDESLKNDPIKARESQLHAYVTEKYNISDRIFQHKSYHFYPQHYSFIKQTIIHKESCLTC